MADDSSKITITLNADTGQFTTAMGDVLTQLGNAKTSGEGAFTGMTGAIVGLNQGLELGEKLIGLVGDALETISKVEAFDNQRLALNALGSEVGLTTKQLDQLILTIQKASGDTLTTAQATSDAFKLLNAGFKSETIPGLIEFAQRIVETKPQVGDLQTVVNGLARALETGSTRQLKMMGLALNDTGDRAATLNSILQFSQQYIKTTGDGYENFGARMSTAFSEAKEKTENFFGTFLRGTGIQLFGTQTEKAQVNLKALQDQMQAINNAAAAGKDSIEMYTGGPNGEPAMNRMVSLAQARVLVTTQMTAEQNKLNTATGAEKSEIDKATEGFVQQAAVKKQLDATTQGNIRAVVNKQMNEQMLNDDTQYAANATEIAKNVENARKQAITNTYNEQLKAINGQILSESQYAAKYAAIEKTRLDATQAMMISDDTKKKSIWDAETAYYEKNSVMISGIATRSQAHDVELENEAFAKETQRLQLTASSKDAFNKEIESKEAAHQQRLAAITQQYSKPSFAAVKTGWEDAIGQMAKSNENFGQSMSKTFVGAQHTISNSFVQMAKDHQFSITQMLNDMLEYIGEQAINMGTLNMFQGAATLDPGLVGIGAAEVALGSALVGAGSGGGTSSTDTSSAGTTDTSQQNSATTATTTTPTKSASIVVQGDFLATSQTAQRLQEIIRQNSDVTDFSITAQGQNYG